MKALLILWARALAVLVATILVLAAVQQWDKAETQSIRISLARGA